MGRGGLTPPPLQTAPGCGGQWCWSVFFSLPSSQRERKRSHQRVKSLARNPQSQESRVNVTWAHQNLLSQTPRSTLALENALVGGTSRGTTALAARRASAPCSAGSQCTSSATRSQTWAVLGCATTSTLSLGRATRASPTTPTRTALVQQERLAVRVQQGIHWKRNPMHGRRWQPQCSTWPTS